MKKDGALSSVVGALKSCFELNCQMQIFLYNLLNSDVFRYFGPGQPYSTLIETSRINPNSPTCFQNMLQRKISRSLFP